VRHSPFVYYEPPGPPRARDTWSCLQRAVVVWVFSPGLGPGLRV